MASEIISQSPSQARSQDLEKGGAILKEWEVCKRPWLEFSLTLNQFQTVCQNLRRNVSKRSKIQTFFPPKIRWSPKKKKKKKKKKRSSPKFRVIFPPKSKIQTFFPPKIRWSPKKKKKKKVFAEVQGDFSSKISQLQTFQGGLFSHGGGYFQFFTENRPQKHKKHAILHTSQANGGGSSPPRPPPWLRYCTQPIEYSLIAFFLMFNIMHMHVMFRLVGGCIPPIPSLNPSLTGANNIFEKQPRIFSMLRRIFHLLIFFHTKTQYPKNPNLEEQHT